MTKQIENLDTIKKAIEVEIKHRYINIRGQKSNFSTFICNEIKNISKLDKKNPKWEYLFKNFERYSIDDVNARTKSVKQLITHLQNPFELEKKPIHNKPSTSNKNPEEVDVMYVKGVGPKLASIFNKLGIYTANDLLHYYPRKHLNYSIRTPIEDLKIGDEVTVFGTIKSTKAFVTNKRTSLTVLSIKVSDGTGIAGASWFYGKSNKYMLDKYKAQYPVGSNIVMSGTVKWDDYNRIHLIDKPQCMIVSGGFDDNNQESLHMARIVPVYNLTENLNIKTVRNVINNAITAYVDNLKDFVPEYLQKELGLMKKTEAIRQIHFPESDEALQEAKRRLIFEELFFVQLRLALTREQTRQENEGIVIEIKEGGLVDKFLKSLPFELTNAQKQAFEEIVKDLNNKEPMQRLLQGDVGSGKTVVACMALLSAVENGYQGAIMAPTEILAEQHYKNFIQWLTPFGISLGLFVGKHGAKLRREFRQGIKNGQINIAVGTHALIQDDIEFNNLGFVVIDEQHRFGVKQRTALRNKGDNKELPEMLTMTATPIPRTLALTVHGDLDLTIIDELPAGRKPVKTALITAGGRKKVYELIRKELEKNHQAYIVFPLIEESESLSAKAATIEAEKLQEGVFKDYKVGLVHGKMPSSDKDKAMEDFRDKKFDILVSTTVIEVGVDVPNATVMAIENAERFGLSQLHQLRGRVGRSDIQSYCVLITDSKSQETRERLDVMTQTSNGFIIAEKDLQIRGPGEFIGTRQSGIPDLLLADIVRDADILEIAREKAFEFVKKYDIKKFPTLNKKMSQKVEDGLKLIGSG